MHLNGKKDRILLADLVITEIGSVRKTAKLLGIDPAKVTKWRWPPERKGSGGNIPKAYKTRILDLAEEMGLDITAEDLVRGYRKVPA